MRGIFSSVLPCISFLLVTCFIYAQTVTEKVKFDQYASPTDNDLSNLFSGGGDMFQDTVSGITGGAVSLPDSIDWGNDNATYCSKYKNGIGTKLITKVAFKYHDSLINTTKYQRAVSLWLKPVVNSNRYIIATVERTKAIGIYSYAWNNNASYFINLLNDHWYQLSLTAHTTGGINGDEIEITAEVFDLGTSGTSSPVSIGADTGIINDLTFATDTAIRVSFSGARWGGSSYLDDFSYQGVKSADSCIEFTQVAGQYPAKNNILIYPNPVKDILYIEVPAEEGPLRISIFNLMGQVVYSSKGQGGLNVIDLQRTSCGIYLIQVDFSGNIRYSRITLMR